MSEAVSSLIIAERLQKLYSLLPEGVELVAISKFQPISSIQAAYDLGQRKFGESRVQELLEKIERLPDDIEWHFIGHLQTNKVKYIIGKTKLIQSVDSERLISILDLESRKQNVITDVLLQVHVAAEETKFGFTTDELMDFFESGKFESYNNIRICGLMAMATNTDKVEIVRNDFQTVSDLFRNIKLKYNVSSFNILSMGMSEDWPIAVEEGATLIRVGSCIFGPS